MTQQESGWKPFEMSAERAAALICRGLARNRPIIAFPFLLALLSRIGGILPDRVRRWTDVPFRFTAAWRRRSPVGRRAAGPSVNQNAAAVNWVARSKAQWHY
jgi:hypothetical protein